VGGRTQIVDIDEWGDRPKRSNIVAIGSQIDSQQLNDLFNACLIRHDLVAPGSDGAPSR
jgi:hypothetical protein